jgi:hypothetical protein
MTHVSSSSCTHGEGQFSRAHVSSSSYDTQWHTCILLLIWHTALLPRTRTLSDMGASDRRLYTSHHVMHVSSSSYDTCLYTSHHVMHVSSSSYDTCLYTSHHAPTDTVSYQYSRLIKVVD